ncbi:MAG: rod shape-determining protein MreC [Candidatus Dependentiae bacterium]|nr:rod shape-determining protein MreC [Candidatus Dependentiae bacterium]
MLGLTAWTAHYCFSNANTLETISSYVMYPVLVAQHKLIAPIKALFDNRRSMQEMHVLLQSMQAERDELLAQNVQLNSLMSYNEEIKELMLFKKQYNNADAILAQVLVRHFSDQSHYFLIDKGSNAGMKVDMVAIYKQCLLGKVVEVQPLYSKVMLVTDTVCKVAAYCAHTQASGIHEGNNQEQMTGLRYVSHLTEIETDDLVLSSGDGLVFPKGFALGKISSCTPEGLFYDVTVKPLLDLRRIEHCFIIQKGAVMGLDVNPGLMALCEEHENNMHEQKQLAQVSVQNQEPIKIAPIAMELMMPLPMQEPVVSVQELVQQQRYAAQDFYDFKPVIELLNNTVA